MLGLMNASKWRIPCTPVIWMTRQPSFKRMTQRWVEKLDFYKSYSFSCWRFFFFCIQLSDSLFCKISEPIYKSSVWVNVCWFYRTRALEHRQWYDQYQRCQQYWEYLKFGAWRENWTITTRWTTVARSTLIVHGQFDEIAIAIQWEINFMYSTKMIKKKRWDLHKCSSKKKKIVMNENNSLIYEKMMLNCQIITRWNNVQNYVQ